MLTTASKRVVDGVGAVLWSLLVAVGLILAINSGNVAKPFRIRVEKYGAKLAAAAPSVQ